MENIDEYLYEFYVNEIFKDRYDENSFEDNPPYVPPTAGPKEETTQSAGSSILFKAVLLIICAIFI